MMYINNFVYAFICTIGFAILFNVPKTSLIKSGFAGALGWTIFIITNQIFETVVVATFIASFVIALIGEAFAIIDKQPLTVYITPGIVPLVPGFGLYYTMLSLLEKNFEMAINYGTESLMIAIAIAGALTIMLSFNSYRRKKRSNL